MIGHIIENAFDNYKKRGNIYRVPCIYHEETEPSLDINLDTESPFFGICKCWGCKKTVTIRQFFLDMGWGVEILPKELRLKKFFTPKNTLKTHSILKPNENHSKFKMFFADENPSYLEKTFLKYLYKRGFNSKIIKQNLLGFVGATSDQFDNSIIIPYYNYNYDFVYYIGRKVNSTIRYVNLPNKDGFYGRKDVIFNMLGFLNADHIIICEGAFNAMSWNMLQIPNMQAIATSGTEFSKEQFNILIQNPKKELILAFDKDAEGIQANLITKLIGVSPLSEIRFKDNLDANDILQTKDGLKKLKQLLSNRIQAKRYRLGS